MSVNAIGSGRSTSQSLAVAVGVVFGALALLQALRFVIPQAPTPPHLLNHPVFFREGLLSDEEGDAMMALAKELQRFPTNVQDVRFYTALHEHVGEAVPINADGKCDHPLMVPDSKETNCILPGRADVARHYLLTGGMQGLKQSFGTGASRLQSFGRYHFNTTFTQPRFAPARALFEQPSFKEAAKTVCPCVACAAPAPAAADPRAPPPRACAAPRSRSPVRAPATLPRATTRTRACNSISGVLLSTDAFQFNFIIQVRAARGGGGGGVGGGGGSHACARGRSLDKLYRCARRQRTRLCCVSLLAHTAFCGGQLHIDAPYFWGAGRREFPQWLLAVMVFSNLFSEEFIDQVLQLLCGRLAELFLTH